MRFIIVIATQTLAGFGNHTFIRGIRVQNFDESRRPDNSRVIDDDGPDETAPTTITEPPSDDRVPIEEPSHQPWLVPGTGGSF